MSAIFAHTHIHTHKPLKAYIILFVPQRDPLLYFYNHDMQIGNARLLCTSHKVIQLNTRYAAAETSSPPLEQKFGGRKRNPNIQVYSNVSFEKVACVAVSPHYFHARGAFRGGCGGRFFYAMYRRRKHDSRERGISAPSPFAHGLLISPKPHDLRHGARWAQMGSRCAGVSHPACSPWSLLLSFERRVSVTPSRRTSLRKRAEHNTSTGTCINPR